MAEAGSMEVVAQAIISIPGLARDGAFYLLHAHA